MNIPEKTWLSYIDKLAAADAKAAELIRAYLQKNEIISLKDWEALIDYAFGVATSCGEASAALAAEFYDAVAAASNAGVAAAVPAETASYGEVAKAVRSSGKSGNAELVSASVARLVKTAGVDTTMQNAIRDGAEWAWIPHGETCAFCLTLASRGWQRASKKALSGGHASHIHNNCNCSYAVRFDGKSSVGGYDPEAYLGRYKDAKEQSAGDPLNFLRREMYAENREEINAQKRAAYAQRQERKASTGGSTIK